MNTSQVPNDLMYLYESTEKSISGYKEKQWKLAVNATLLTGALEWLNKENQRVPLNDCILKSALILGAIYLVILFFLYNHKIKEARQTLHNLSSNKKFTDDFRAAKNHKKDVRKNDLGDYLIIVGFIVYIVILLYVLFAFH